MSAPLVQFRHRGRRSPRRRGVSDRAAGVVARRALRDGLGALAVARAGAARRRVRGGVDRSAARRRIRGRSRRAIAFGLRRVDRVVTLFHVVLGLAAFWLGDIAPVYWIWQKLTFVLGGLLLPLQFYPDLFVRVARLTPFPAMLAGPASFVTLEPPMPVGVLVVALAFWALVGWVIARAAFSRAVRRLHVNGG